METQNILNLLQEGKNRFQLALTKLGDHDAIKDKEIAELRKANEEIYKRNVELVKKYGK